jgi:hypothetical protein
MTMNLNKLLGLGAWACVAMQAACTGPDAPPRAQAAPVHIDSAIPKDEELRRFRRGLIEPAELTGGARSRDALVRSYVSALERGDTAALAALVITKAEFAYIYYPTNPQARPPYDLSPGLMWFMLQQRSEVAVRSGFSATTVTARPAARARTRSGGRARSVVARPVETS